MSQSVRQAVFTGWHMLAVIVAFFGVIIAVNVTMAMFAHSSWTGFVVENSYVASQEFNARIAETRAQAALGWTGTLTLRDGRARYALKDAAGRPVPLAGLTVTFRRPVDDREDTKISMTADADGSYTTDRQVADGAWLVEIEADSGLGRPWRETLRLHVAAGSRT